MKKLLTIFTMLFAIVFLSMPALADPPVEYDAVVVGTGDFTIDNPAVQSAVDGGGKILLKGTFDFGDYGQVTISNDIQIYGEADNKGKPQTKINGGVNTFYTPVTETVPAPKIEIRKIHFDGALFTPLFLSFTSGAVISGNKITNVEPFPWSPPWPFDPSLVTHWHVGAFFSPEDGFPPRVTGNLVFENNEVDMDPNGYNPEVTMGQGVFIVSTWGATIQVIGNTFTNVTRNSIECLNNLPDGDGIGSVIIERNRIFTPISGPAFPSIERPNGIVVGWFMVTPSGPYSEVSIDHNYIEALSGLSDNSGMGIAILADDVKVKSNHIVLGGAAGAYGILQVNSSGVIRNNKIEGSGYFALLAILGANDNTFVGNNINNFNPHSGGAHIGLIGDYNTVKGGSGLVYDVGTGNVINGDFVITP